MIIKLYEKKYGIMLVGSFFSLHRQFPYFRSKFGNICCNYKIEIFTKSGIATNNAVEGLYCIHFL